MHRKMHSDAFGLWDGSQGAGFPNLADVAGRPSIHSWLHGVKKRQGMMVGVWFDWVVKYTQCSEQCEKKKDLFCSPLAGFGVISHLPKPEKRDFQESIWLEVGLPFVWQSGVRRPRRSQRPHAIKRGAEAKRPSKASSPDWIINTRPLPCSNGRQVVVPRWPRRPGIVGSENVCALRPLRYI